MEAIDLKEVEKIKYNSKQQSTMFLVKAVLSKP